MYRFLFILFMLSAAVLPAQAVLEIAAEEVCWTNNSVETSLTRYVLLSSRTPSSSQVIAYVDATGAIVDPTVGGTITLGYCGCCNETGGGDDDWRYYYPNSPTNTNPIWRYGRVVIGNVSTPDTSHVLQLYGNFEFKPDTTFTRLSWPIQETGKNTPYYGLLLESSAGETGTSFAGGRNHFTIATHNTVFEKTRLGALAFAGNNPNDTDLKLSAFLEAAANGAWSATNTGSNITVYVTQNNTLTPHAVASFQHDGRFQLGKYANFNDGVPTALIGHQTGTSNLSRHPISGTAGAGKIPAINSTNTGLEWITPGGGEAPDSLLFGNKYNTVGFLFQDNFSGTTLNNNHYEVVGSSIYVGTSQLNYGVSVNNKLVVPDSTIAGWQRFIQMSRNFGQIEKGELVIKFSPTTKNVGNGIAIWQHSPVLFFAQQSAIRIDLSNGINSGRVGYGNDTTNVLYWSQALNFSIGDTLELRLVRNPFQTEVYFKNLTQNTPTAYGVFPVLSWGTQGKLRLVSFGGGQEIYNWSLLSNQRKYDGNSGVVFIGNSITSGFTVSNKSERWTDIVMRGQQHLYENLAIQSYTSVEIENENLLAIADSINAKHMVLSIGYNDVSQSVNLDSFENRVNRIVTRAQAIGYNVIITSIFPRIGALPTSYNIRLQNVATARNCKYIDITTATSANNAVNLNMLDGDNIHPNEQGHLAIANAIIAAAPELTTIITDSLNSSLSIFNLPAGSASDNIITINPVTKQLREYPNLFNPEFWLRLETGQAQQVGNIGVTGNILAGGFLQIRNNNQPGRIGFNDGLGTSIGAPNNLIITNSGVNGIGSPQSFDQVSGSGNIKIFAGWDYAAKANSTGTISGSLNTFLNSTFGTNIVSGNNNSLISAYFLGNLSGSNNLGWGQRAIAGVNSGSNNIHLISLGNVNGNSFTFPATLSNSIVIGGLYDFVPTEVVQNGEVIINAPIRSDRYYTFGPKGGIITSTFMRPGLGVQGTNTPGEPWIFQGARGTGGAQSGIIAYEFSTKNASGSNVQSSYTRTMQIRERGVVIGRNATLIQSEDALLDLQSISSALVLPRLTTTQINNNYVGGVLSIALTSGGSGYTNGNVELSFTGGGGSGARGYATISSGVVQSVTLTERGTGYTSNPSVSVTSGIGNGASITASIGASDGGLVFNSTTGQVNMYSSGLRVLNAGITGSATLDFADTASGNYADLTITVTGAADGDVVSLGIPNASMPAGACSFTAWVSATDTVTVRFSNFSGGNLNPASGIFKIFVTK